MKNCGIKLGLILAGLAWAGAGAIHGAEADAALDIPFTKYTLTNGLTLIVHEDHKAPLVAVNVWYHVGSKNEKLGKTGFAHLFEHLMFNGSEHFDDDYFKAMEKVGATQLNGTTSEDRTNYFEDAPKEALDFLLWMESDRMGHLLGAITQSKLDEQRGVVQNEKRQGENQPYGIARELITKGAYPPGHPYSWTVIGSMADLDAASLEDVKEWFRSYYGAANATVVVAGDVTPGEVLKKVERYFGDIPSGPPVVRHEGWIAKRFGQHRQVAEDRVPLARVYKVWNIPPFGDADGDYLNLVSDILAAGKTSRLYKRLVYDDQIATDVRAYVDLSEIGGRFVIAATARPGIALARVEEAIDEELGKFLKEGPTEREVERVRTQDVAGFIRGLERIGGFGGKSDILARNQVFLGKPDFYKVTLDRVQHANGSQLLEASRRWLSDGVYVLEVHPFPKYQTLASDVDRTKLPVPALEPEVRFPRIEHASLANGLKVLLAQRHSAPLVEFKLQLDAGFAADQLAAPGTAKLAMSLLDEGTQTRSALQISEALDLTGAALSASSDLDTSSVSLSALKTKLDPALELYADVILHPDFPEANFKRRQKQQLDAIRREESEPNSMALRVLPRFLYGPGHAYNTPLTGSGTEESVAKLTREQVRAFYRTWFKPNNATLIVAGDTTMPEILPKIERLFGQWPSGTVPHKEIGPVAPVKESVVYLMNRPGAIQSVIFAGQLAPPRANPDEIAIETMNHILGGTFTSRINMNLREDKHWSYGARTSLTPARGERPFLVVAPVQTDKTPESMAEIAKELSGIVGPKPVTADELGKAQKDETLKLSGAWETTGQLGLAMGQLVRFGLPEDYFLKYPEQVLKLKVEDVEHAAREIVHPGAVIWVVVGDLSKIEEGIRKLGLGEIRVLDAAGRNAEVPGGSGRKREG